VQDVVTVREHDPKLFERVKRGELSGPLAARRVRRRLRDQGLSPPGPMPEGLYELIYADPPWQLGNPDGPYAPESHYPTLPLEEIEALEVPAAEDAVLFLWAVSALLPQALAVIEAWGFQYKSNLVWEKEWIGPGVWLRNRHELLLVARRGAFSPPEPEDRVDSVLKAPRGRHSEKPARVYELIEQMYPHASKLELFARSQRPGWIAWGNEVPA
jgi:N6-adenosine-specific RNA methylase IME4